MFVYKNALISHGTYICAQAHVWITSRDFDEYVLMMDERQVYVCAHGECMSSLRMHENVLTHDAVHKLSSCMKMCMDACMHFRCDTM